MCIRDSPKPGAPATIPTFNLVSMVDLMKALRADPTSHSVIEFNDVNHFDPWILMQSVCQGPRSNGGAVLAHSGPTPLQGGVGPG